MNLLNKHITPILTAYLTTLVLLNILPINGSESTLNNNYTLGLRWDYLGHALVMIPLFPLLMLKYNTLQPLTSDAGGYFTRSPLLLITISITLAIFLEGLQYFIPYRTFNVNDIMASEIGVVVAMVFIKFRIVRSTKSDSY